MIHNIWPLVDAPTMRALDTHTIEKLGVPGQLLMESAGRAVTEAVLRELRPGGTVLVACGAGNNGGDGLVVARHLATIGVPVRIAALDPSKLRGDAGANLERVRGMGMGLEPLEALGRGQADVVVDGLLGTGLTRPVEGPLVDAIATVNRRRPASRVVSVDLPSGLHAATGQVLGCAIEADVTVTISLPKLALAVEPGRSHAGRVVVARVGIADEAPDATVRAELWTRAAAGERLPERPRPAHKGTFGHVLLVASSAGKTGAAALAAHGALRAGAGLVTVACPAGLNDILEVKCTEAMTVPVADTPARGLAARAEGPILELAETRSVVGLGPGLGTEDETRRLVRGLVAHLERPLVVDADGLNLLAGELGLLRARPAPTILTPHPGEAARLLDESAGSVNQDRVAAARRLAHETGAVVLLKGAATVAAHPDGRAIVNPTGGPALASGGTGDVLTGVVAALLGQGVEARSAAALAAYVHGLAADRLEARRGSSGVAASDVADALPEAAQALREAARRGRSVPVLMGERLALPFPEP